MGKRADNAEMHRKMAVDYAEMLQCAKHGPHNIVRRGDRGRIIRELADLYHVDARTVRRAVRRYPEITNYQPSPLSILRNAFGVLSRRTFRRRDPDGRDDESE